MMFKKKWLMPVLIFAASIEQADAIMVAHVNIRDRVNEIGRQYLQAQGFSVSGIPARIAPEYRDKISEIVDLLTTSINAQGRSYIDLEDIQDLTRSMLHDFVQTLKTLVKSFDLSRRADDIIKRVTREENINPETMAATFVAEYHRKGEAIVNRMRAIMREDGRDYVREKEIEDETRRHMKDLFARIKRDNSNWGSTSSSTNNQSDVPFSWFDFFFGTGSQQPTNVVEQRNIDTKVLEIANQILRNKKINPDNIPTRAVGEFSDAIQTIIRTVRNGMGYQSTTTTEVITSVAEQALITVINKIKFVNETCVICQDDYQRADNVGILNCGHAYHNDCIQAWLSRQQSCPLCRQEFVRVTSKERVP